ncbi:MAG: TolC family protein [Kofleriaceae bacterium]|nr:TolC family protein [Kofleriaceae bacterium]
MLTRWVALVLVLSASVASAEETAYVPPDFLQATPPLPDDRDPSTAMRLDLAEALRIAVHQNLGVVLERHASRIADLGITVADGLFEPTLEAGYAHGSSQAPPSSAQEGMPGQILEYSQDRWNVSLGKRLATGMQLNASFVTDRSKSALGTAVTPLNYRSQLALSITQPLLRGFSLDLDVPQLPVLQAKLGSEREKHQVEVVIAQVVERTESAYWDVVRALYRYDLEKRSLARAELQLALTKRQIDSGVLPPSDVIAAESTLAQFQLQLLQAEEGIEAASDQLRAIMNLPREQWTKPILPIEIPTFAPQTISAQDAMTTALSHRPELVQVDLDLQASALAVRKAENDKLPQIDLGLTGSLVGQDDTYNGSLDQLGGFEARGWNVLLNLTWTPLRRATKAAAEIERTRHQVAKTQRDQLVQQIWLAVREAVRNQQSAARQVLAAAKFRELAAKSLEIEQRKFLNGQSSNFLVAQHQQELAAAQVAELGAMLDHKKASAALSLATGELLGARHIELTTK